MESREGDSVRAPLGECFGVSIDTLCKAIDELINRYDCAA